MFFEYKIQAFNEIDAEINLYKGLTYGSDFLEALESLKDYYGEDNIIAIKHLKCCANEVLEFGPERTVDSEMSEEYGLFDYARIKEI